MKKIVIVLIIMCCFALQASAQDPLSRNVSLDVNRQRLDQVLEILSNKADFYFSYNSKIVQKDSLVSLNVRNKPVKEILQLLFNNTYEFKVSGNYVIIRKAPIRMTVVTSKAVTEERQYAVSGYVYDEQSGAAIYQASVYEKKQLAAALTNNMGYFKLKLKGSKASFATLTISKEFYEDTSIRIEPRHNQQLSITMIPIDNPVNNITIAPGDYLIADSLQELPVYDTTPVFRSSSDSLATVEKTGMGKFLLSTKQKIQAINLKDFFTTRPFQASVVPGLGSHGKMSGQVINNFSLNLFGGYTAGTNGLEIGGLFNIDKKEVKYVQAAGLFNIVGGQMKGVQIGGLNNTVMDTSTGVQAAGINNMVKGKFTGVQIGGIYNHVTDSVKGVQLAGIANFAKKKVGGVQLAGISNISNKEITGVQIAGILNYSKKLRGVQFGLINIADTSYGYSIGLINIVMKGYHKLNFSTNEITNVNAAFKTGNSKLYSILQAGVNTGNKDIVYSFGYGLGSEIYLNKRKTLSLNPELSSEYLYLGSWDYTNILNKARLNFTVKLFKFVSVYAGPVYNVYISDQYAGIDNYRFPIPSSSYKVTTYNDKVSGWIGWNVGINFF